VGQVLYPAENDKILISKGGMIESKCKKEYEYITSEVG
jgi:hypothetical protein